jgi:hypothetical protein
VLQALSLPISQSVSFPVSVTVLQSVIFSVSVTVGQLVLFSVSVTVLQLVLFSVSVTVAQTVSLSILVKAGQVVVSLNIPVSSNSYDVPEAEAPRVDCASKGLQEKALCSLCELWGEVEAETFSNGL